MGKELVFAHRIMEDLQRRRSRLVPCHPATQFVSDGSQLAKLTTHFQKLLKDKQ